MRRCGLVLLQVDTNKNEHIFRSFVILITFVAVYLVGLTDEDFLYRFDIKLLSNPLIVSLMLTESILLFFIVMKRINKIQHLNQKCVEIELKAESLQIKIKKMSYNPDKYQRILQTDSGSQFQEYMIRNRILVRYGILIRLNKKEEYINASEEGKIKIYQKELVALGKTLDKIQESIKEDNEHFSLLFLQLFEVQTSEFYEAMIFLSILYIPFIYKAVVNIYTDKVD